jgi:antitoxin component YwqK of YwqJK toxin-antitoxin module
VQELKEQYDAYNRIVNDPDIFWIVPLNFDDTGKFISREQFEAIMMQKLILEGKQTLQEKIAAMTYHISASQRVKADIRNNLLPELEILIKERTNSPNPNINLNNNTAHYPNNTSSNSHSFDNVLNKLTSDEHLDELSFDKILAQSNGAGTVIQNTQIESFDGGWDSAGSDNYSSCPKKKPDDRSSFRAYPNGQTSGNTYRNCVYFINGYLSREEPFVNGKLDGLKTSYIWSNKYNFPYVSTRTNYSNGKRNGLEEIYSLAKNGAVYRMRLTTYSDGMQHGDSVQWHENGQTSNETKYLEGKAVLQYNYNKEGSFIYCTKWGNDKNPRDCKTGKIRR